MTNDTKQHELNTHEKGKIDAAGTTALLATLLFWASGPLFIRSLSNHVDAWTQNFWRYTAALVFLSPLLIWAFAKKRIDSRFMLMALIPAAANTVMQCFWGWTYYYLEAGFATLISRSSIFWVLIFSFILFPDERGLVRSKRFWLGTVLSLAGITGILVAKPDFTATGSLIGIGLMLTCAVFWAVYTLSARMVFRHRDARLGFAVVAMYTVPLLGIIAVIFGKPGKVASLPAWPVWQIIISGVVSIAGAHTCFYIALRALGASICSLTISLIPFITAILSVLVMGEKLNLIQWLSGAVLIAGSTLAIYAQQHLKIEKHKPLTNSATKPLPGQ